MKVLVIGSGGREHALAWRLHNSPSVTTVYSAPGNPGIAQLADCHTATDYVQLANHLQVDLTVVGPEAPLVAGVVDHFRRLNMPIVGPTAENAALEGSKIHSKRLMESIGIPSACFLAATTPQQAREALGKFQYPIVLKTDGLAAGKGVVIAQTPAEAEEAITQLPYPLVIEEFLQGEEVSFIVLCDGTRGIALEPSQDHKRIFDNDRGPNTGGMGAYSDSRILTPNQRSQILEIIINPVVRTTKFTGFLYAGLMMTPHDGPHVLEFNVRLGDPETQPLMMRLESDWGEALMAAARGRLPDTLQWSPDPATCVVLASAGYPGTYATGHTIAGLDRIAADAVAFHAGTKQIDNRIVTSGGRVLGVTAKGATLQDSMNRAYAAVSNIHFEGMQYRSDIGQKGLKLYNNNE